MKKLILVLVLLYTTVGFSQYDETYLFSLSFDPKLVVDGAYDYNDESVLDLRLNLMTRKRDVNEYGIFLEYSNLKPYGYFNGGFVYQRNILLISENVETLLGAEVGFIHRGFPSPTSNVFFSTSLNMEMRIYLFEHFGLSALYQYTYRGDLGVHYDDPNPFRLNVKVGIVYRITRAPRRR